MKILSIETSGKICAVALTEDKTLIKEEIIEDENTHSVKLMPLIDKLLRETNTYLSDIDLFACDVGPGSFTGIRIGISTIKAFMDAKNKKAVGVTSLEILARNIEEDGIICSLIDAKNNNVYYGIFEKIGNEYITKETKFENINNIIEMTKKLNNKIFFIGNGSILYKDMIESKIDNANLITDEKLNKLNAFEIGKIAFERAQKSVDSNNLTPIYLRQSSAERLKK